MRQAKRYLSSDRTLTLGFVAWRQQAPVFFSVNLYFFYVFMLFFLAVFFFSGLVLKYSPIFHDVLTDYQQVRSLNSLQQIKIDIALKRNFLLKENIHKLKVQEEEIKDLLNVNFDKESSYSVNLYDYPMIYTQRIVSKRGEVGRVLIDDNIVVEYFDNEKQPTAYRRALITAERLKGLLAQKKYRYSYSIKQKAEQVYAYADKQVIFVVNPSDVSHLDVGIDQKDLAKIWVKNIKVALAKEKDSHSLAEKLPFLDKQNRRKSKLYKTIYTNINYPAHAAVIDTVLNNERELQNIEHMLKLAQQEILTYKKSFADLKDIIKSYKVRFEHTPSIMPLAQSYILSPFGWRRHPILKSVRFHTGIDLPTWRDAPIRATAAGVVVESGWKGGYGLRTVIDHGYGFSSVYAHSGKLLVSVGQKVAKGQRLALAGDTGLAQGVHCHYEVRFFNRPINPANFLNLNIFTASKNW